MKVGQELWRKLGALAEDIQEPSLLTGDFNEVLYTWEKSSGLRDRYGRSIKFLTCLKLCVIRNVGFEGVKFTWKRGMCHEKLDRGLIN